MKILYICRLYSGFEGSLSAGVWSPKGAPTIAKMLDQLDQSEEHELHLFLTQKLVEQDLFPKKIKLDGFGAEITVLHGPSMFPKWFGKFQTKLNDLYQLIVLMGAYITLKPDLVYCDRVNILPAAILARFTKARVIWRVMGVLQIMHKAARSNTVRAKFLKWLWKSPFRGVVCSMDGSDGAPWLEKNLAPYVPYYMLLNGVDKDLEPDISIQIDKNKTNILFVGRLEPMKGTEEFIEAFAELAVKDKNAQAVIAGDGSLMEKMKTQVSGYDLEERVSFLGSLSPAQLKHLRQSCDYYVSLNTHGNLTNVNLEALSDHLPAIIPASDPERGIDSDTDKLIPADVFYRFGKVGDKDALVKAMKYMSSAKNREVYRKNAKACANQILPTWNERIEQELSIFSSVSSDNGYDSALVISDLGSGGAQKVATSLAEDLAAQDRKIAVVTLSGVECDFFTLDPHIRRITLDLKSQSTNVCSALLSNAKRVWAIRKTLKYIAPDRVVSFIAPTNILTVAATIGLKTRLIISERNDPSRQSFGRLWDGLRVLTYRFADKVTANSEIALKTMKVYVPEDKLVLVPNGLVKPKKSYIVAQQDKEKIILNVARLYPQKAQHILLEAFAEIYQSHKDWKLVIAGDGPLKDQLVQQSRDLKIEHATVFTGVVDNPYELYAKASIFVLPSLHEGTPNALLEAMSCKIPSIVSSACSGAAPYIDDGRSGLIFKVNKAEDLKEKLLKLMNDQDFRSKLGQQAQKNVEPLYQSATYELWKEAF